MKNIYYKVLWSTIEDFVGLWEILWELNSLLPENSEIENQEIIKGILSFFLEQQLIIFYSNKWGNKENKELSFNEALKRLEEKKFWIVPSINEDCVKISSTEKGEKFYNEEMLDLKI